MSSLFLIGSCVCKAQSFSNSGSQARRFSPAELEICGLSGLFLFRLVLALFKNYFVVRFISKCAIEIHFDLVMT